MASLGTTQMAVTIALTVIEAHFVQQVVHLQVLNEHELSNDSVLNTVWNVIFFINKKVVIVPALLMLSTFVMGIVGATIFIGALVTRQIIVSLATATNLVLTALTGKLVQLVGYYGSSVQHHMLVLTAHSVVVTTRPLDEPQP
ncbi:hypothetical protein B0H13DRAFT_1856598 [Mycena leptocephala]|nr:hypothetical protein B0H13DRAFT_1856598 [Mycena leptocephala]